MIAPRSQLIFFSLFVLVPPITLAGIQPSMLPVSLLAACFLCLLPLIDLVLGFGRHRDLIINLPAQARGTLGQPFGLDFEVKSTTPARRPIRISAVFPDSLRIEKPIISFTGDAGKRIFPLQIIGVSRGN